MKTSTLSKDLTAGLLVSLIALPLSMGIAMASGFPPSSGIIAAICGGIVTSFLGGAPLTIKGPAAGLIVIVAGAVAELNDPSIPGSGVTRAAAIVVAAGVLQVLCGLLRGGMLAELIPLSVIHGMLAGIGIIIIGKQLHSVCGVSPVAKTPGGLLLEVPHSVLNCNPEIIVIGVLGFLIMSFYGRIVPKNLQRIPAVLVVMSVAMALGLLFDLGQNHNYEFFHNVYSVGPQYLIHLPSSLRDSIFHPDWGALFTGTSIKYIIFFFLVGSVESLLTVSAVTSMDPQRRKVNSNRDMIALGLGNMVSGLIGGLPMISEIVRSKANVDAGAQSSKANFFHGVLLLVYLTALGGVLGHVPSAALAGILVFVGLRLASPQEFKHAYHAGPEQFFFFALTCTLTVVEDLLVGVGAGLVTAYLFQLWKGARPRHLVQAPVSIERNDSVLRATVNGSALGSNFYSFRREIEGQIGGVEEIEVRFAECSIVDFAFLEKLSVLESELEGVTVRRSGLEGARRPSSHPNATAIRSIRVVQSAQR